MHANDHELYLNSVEFRYQPIASGDATGLVRPLCEVMPTWPEHDARVAMSVLRRSGALGTLDIKAMAAASQMAASFPDIHVHIPLQIDPIRGEAGFHADCSMFVLQAGLYGVHDTHRLGVSVPFNIDLKRAEHIAAYRLTTVYDDTLGGHAVDFLAHQQQLPPNVMFKIHIRMIGLLKTEQPGWTGWMLEQNRLIVTHVDTPEDRAALEDYLDPRIAAHQGHILERPARFSVQGAILPPVPLLDLEPQIPLVRSKLNALDRTPGTRFGPRG